MTSNQRKYFSLFILGPVANVLWAYWALPAMNETGTGGQTLQWIATQALLPVLLLILIRANKPYVYWIVVAYSVFILLHALGIFGWAMMGAFTPLSVYVICAIFFVMSLGLLYRALKDLNFGKKERRYDIEDQ